MTPWFVRPQPRPEAAMRCFCFPYAGVGASAFRGWAAALGPALDVFAVQPPGRESRLRETPVSSVDLLAQAVAEQMAPLIDRPYVVFGHSLGAIVAFETVRELRRNGAPDPDHLFVCASRAPHLPWPHPPIRDLEDLSLVAEVNRRYGGSIPPQLVATQELRDVFIPALRADLAALETHRYVEESPLACPVSAFAGGADPMVPISIVEPWSRHTSSSFRLRVIDGGHLFLQTAQPELLAAIRQDVASHLIPHATRPTQSHPVPPSAR